MVMNWSHLVSALMSSGLTQQQIAERVQVKQPTISRLRSGVIKRPGYQLGAALVELYHKRYLLIRRHMAA